MLFPIGTALGTDMYRPRILLLSALAFLGALLNMFVLCEVNGNWPSIITDVLIALVPKVFGGRRPIAIVPTSIGIRAPHVRARERVHERALFEAGQGRGADAAVWLQASYMEGACMAKR